MSLTQSPNGLSYADYIGGKPRYTAFDFAIASGGLTNSPSYNIGYGDVVSLKGGYVVNTSAATAYPPATSPELILGVFYSVRYQPQQLGVAPASFPYWVAGSKTMNAQDAEVAVNIDPKQVYIVQADGPMLETYIGQNFNLGGFNNTSGTGKSGIFVVHTPLATSANWGQVKLLGLAPKTVAMGTNEWGDPYTWVKVSLNSTVLQTGQYGVA
jgi:hypothetical protein